jgi:amino acid transporter
LARAPEDPILKHSRREALIVLATWFLAMTYTLGYAFLYGYGRKVEDLKYVYGFPDWVFWGIVVPWTVCIAFSWWFASVFMRDEDLGEDLSGVESTDGSGQSA